LLVEWGNHSCNRWANWFSPSAGGRMIQWTISSWQISSDYQSDEDMVLWPTGDIITIRAVLTLISDEDEVKSFSRLKNQSCLKQYHCPFDD
jgi:hypothetical protein